MRKKIIGKRVLSLALAVTMGIGLIGCGKANPSSNSEQKERREQELGEKQGNQGGTSNTGYNPYADGPTIRTSFTDYSTASEYEVVNNPSVATYEIASDFSNVDNANRYQYYLSKDEFKNALLTNGFVVTSGGGDEFFGLYEDNRYEYLANFITTDSLLHTYHLYFAYLLKSLEKGYFTENLKTVSGIMVQESLNQYNELAGTEWENAAKRNVAYFSVAAKIFDPNVAVDPLVSDIVDQELALIDTAGGIANSPMMNMGSDGSDPSMVYQEDYSQYIVRGYYTETEELGRYFKAAMWFGRMNFRSNVEDEARSAVLMTKAMENEDALNNWRNVYDVTSFFVGNSDDPGVYDYYPIVESIYADMNISAMAGDTEKWQQVVDALAVLEPPVINSIPIDENLSDEERANHINGFRFMGQRGTFDAAAFQNLVHTKVDGRYLPSAMDIPAVMGSSEAENILHEQGAYDYTNYAENMAKLQQQTAATDSAVWKSTLYNGWLNSLEPLTTTKSDGYPQFMQNTAWARKELNTFLGSYAELKHDTILYAKQVYAEMGGGEEIEPIDFRGYVEPNSDVYARVATLSAMTRDGLQGYGMISSEDAEMLTLLQQLAEQLLTISNKELRNESLTEEEHELIKTYGGQLEHFWEEALKDQANGGYLSTREHPAAIVADIATDPNGYCLEVGTGSVDRIYVVVNVDGNLRIATGTVYSYYEFAQPLNQRLTDEEWRIKLGIDFAKDADGYPIYDAEREEVEQPSWVNSFKISLY